jgi:amino acid transporter
VRWDDLSIWGKFVSAEGSRISMLGAAGLGVGSMVGAGVFALMGEAAMKAGSAVWLSFLMAGVIALLTGHSFVQLGIRYPSRGGVVEYLARAYGPGTFSGGCSILFYIAQLVGMSMIALSFGKFASHLIGIENNLAFWERVLASGLILGLTAINLFGSQLASRVSGKIVLLNIATLSLFAVAPWSPSPKWTYQPRSVSEESLLLDQY